MSSSVCVDVDRCVGCGRCVEVCTASFLALENGKATVSGARCIECGQCEAVCPHGAVVVPGLDGYAGDYETLQVEDAWVPYGGSDTAALVSLMGSRRSCRHFLDREVDPAITRDLVRIGVTAPSGTNCQAWTFTVMSGRSAVVRLLGEVLGFYKRLNRLARMPVARFLSRLGNGELDTYYRKYCRAVERAIVEWDDSGTDRLFFGAPTVILVGARPGASTPMEDALLATQNILLAAHSMGLGTCLIGFAVAALRRDSAWRQRIGIPAGEAVYAAIALGYADQTFHRTARRKRPETRITA